MAATPEGGPRHAGRPTHLPDKERQCASCSVVYSLTAEGCLSRHQLVASREGTRWAEAGTAYWALITLVKPLLLALAW